MLRNVLIYYSRTLIMNITKILLLHRLHQKLNRYFVYLVVANELLFEIIVFSVQTNQCYCSILGRYTFH